MLLSLDWWREEDSNLRPLGYEPNELPLLHPAICECKGTTNFCLGQIFRWKNAKVRLILTFVCYSNGFPT